MGTPNFAKPSNASKYFVVLTSKEINVKICKECNQFHKDYEYNLNELKECEFCSENISEVEITEEIEEVQEYEYDDLISNLGYEIKENGGTIKEERFNDQNYNRVGIGYFNKSKVYGGVEVDVIVKPIIQSAYYEGATLDYLILIEIDGGEWNYSTGSYYDNDLESILNEISYIQENREDLNKGLIKIMHPKIKTFIENSIKELSDKTEEIFETYLEHKLTCTGVFSNGEAIYEHIN